MTKLESRHSESMDIAAPPERVWALIADITNMGRWSPICRRCEWVGAPGKPVAGARFRGYNRLYGARWSRECRVLESEPGRVFAFATQLHGRDSVVWRYEFAPFNGGTRVTESNEILSEPRYLRMMPHVRAAFRRAQQRGVGSTLERVKGAAEAGPRAGAP